MSVRALFRVLNTTVSYDRTRVVKLGPTYATRDGVVCEENRSFSKYTPSGECEIVNPPVEGPIFDEGAYVYLDLFAPDEAPPEPPADGLRVRWVVHKFEVDAHSGSFTVRVYPDGPIRDSLWMNVTNLSELTLGLFRLEPGEKPRPIVIDFRPAP